MDSLTDTDIETRTPIPADFEAPDRLLYGLTARQVAILAAAAAAGYLIWQGAGDRLPLPVTAAILGPLAAAAAVLALGRRDGLSLDAWVLAAVRHRRRPCRSVPAPDGVPAPPGWAPGPDRGDRQRPAVLRLPAHAIAEDGVVDLGGSAAVLVAATTVNIGLRAPGEQAALVAAYARWLNSLSGPTQVVVSAQRVDLSSHAVRVAEAAQTLPHPALADAAADHGDFLFGLARDRDPLWRTVVVASAAPGGPAAPAAAEATRRAERAATALAALGAQTRVLDGPTATALLACAVDPYQQADASWPRATPDTPVTAGRELGWNRVRR
jgi:hypothetical protein